MSNGELAYLVLVVVMFATFIIGVGAVSTWSRRGQPK
jgi:hypothetical protein